MKQFRLLTVIFVVVLVLSMSIAAVPTGAQEDTFVIGVSNGFVGSEWRTQMVQNIEETAQALEEEKGIKIELVIESADVDVQGQIQQIENLINRGVDAIIVNPNDQAALSLTLEDAVAEDIVVIAVDQEVDAFGVLNVVIDQKEWAMISMKWLAEKLGGQGDIVLIEGFVGHPANEARMAGVEEVLEDYPDINVVGRETGSWDQATGQQVMSDFLASLPNIDGVWTQDGMAQGALTAVMNSNLDYEDWPIMVGEARASFMQMWYDLVQEHPDFETIGVVNPPGIGASGLRVAIELLMGTELDEELLQGEFENTLYVPIPYFVVGDDADVDMIYEDVEFMVPEVFTLETVYEEQELADAPGSYTLDGFIDQDQAYSLLTGEEME